MLDFMEGIKPSLALRTDMNSETGHGADSMVMDSETSSKTVLLT